MTSTMSLSYSSRWCPTPEQVMILEELYRNGIRTPNASHIQRITAQLSFYGKITGKNVFYWFQNHKARDRQKLRRKLTKKLQVQQQKLHPCYQHHDKIHQQNGLGFLSPFSTQQPCYSNAVHFLLHERATVVEVQSNVGPSYTWWMSKRQSVMEEKMMRLYDDGGHGRSSSPKTLELFPTTAAALKEDSNSLQNLSHLTKMS